MAANFLDLFSAKVALELGLVEPEQARAALAAADRDGGGLLSQLNGVGQEQLRLVDQGGRRCLYLKGEDTYRRLLAQTVPGLPVDRVQECARKAQQSNRRLGAALVEAGLVDEARDRELVTRSQQAIEREAQETVRGLREQSFQGIETPSRMIAAVAAGLARSPALRRTSRRMRKPSTRAPRPAPPPVSGPATAVGGSAAAVAEGTPLEPLPAPPPLPTLGGPGVPSAPLPMPGGQGEVTAEMSLSLPPELAGSGLEEKYLVVRKLGEGGMGAVYLAYAKEDAQRREKPMALKVVRPGAGAERSKEAAARFKREILATSFCSHENIIEIYDANETRDGSYYMAMEYIEGEQLDEVLKREGPMPIPRLVGLLEQVLSGMVAYHAANIVHRDIKPQNFRVWRDAEGREHLKIMDFGIARILDAADSGMEEQFYRTISGKITGSPAYLSPESITDPDHVDQRADLYSLGITIYRVAANRLPFVAKEASEFLPLHLYSRPPSLKEIAPQTPPALEELYYSLLEKLPNKRIASAAAALELLRTRVRPALGGSAPAGPDGEATVAGVAPEQQLTSAETTSPWPRAEGQGGGAAQLPDTITPTPVLPLPETPATPAPLASPGPAPVGDAAPATPRPGPQGTPIGPRRRGRGPLLVVVLLALVGAAGGAFLAHRAGWVTIPWIPR